VVEGAALWTPPYGHYILTLSRVLGRFWYFGEHFSSKKVVDIIGYFGAGTIFMTNPRTRVEFTWGIALANNLPLWEY